MADTLSEEVRHWCRLGASALTRKTEAAVLSLALGLKKFCRDRASRLIAQGSRLRMPVLFAYMSDGWQGFVFRNNTRSDSEGQKHVRITRVRRHFCLQRGLVKVLDASGQVHSSMVFAEPRPLQHGARSGNFFAALVEFFEPIRLFTRGPIVEVFCFDGELFKSLRRLIIGRKISCMTWRTTCWPPG